MKYIYVLLTVENDSVKDVALVFNFVSNHNQLGVQQNALLTLAIL